MKTLSFEIRSENQAVVDYLARPATIKKLFGLVFGEEPKPATDRAIEVFQCAEAMRSAFQAILSNKDLIQIPFNALLQHTD